MKQEKDMIYLIIECAPLHDPYECDADRNPIAITNNYIEWLSNNDEPTYYEIYGWDGEKMIRIKEWSVPNEEGMAFYYWEKNENPEKGHPHIIQKYPNRTRKNDIPKNIKKEMEKYCDENDNIWLRSCGFISWENDKGQWCVYGEYEDSKYSLGY